MHHDSLELVVQDFVVAVDPSHMTGRDAALRLKCTDGAEDANILIHSGRHDRMQDGRQRQSSSWSFHALALHSLNLCSRLLSRRVVPLPDLDGVCAILYRVRDIGSAL